MRPITSKRYDLTGRRSVLPAAALVWVGFTFSLTAAPTPESRVQAITLRQTTTISGMPPGQGQSAPEITYLSAEAVRQSSPNGNDFIIRRGEGKLISIDHINKTYSEMTFEEIQEAMKKAASEVNEDHESMKAFRQMVGENVGEVTMTEKGPGGVVAGFVTRKYLLHMPPLEVQIWSAPELQMPSFYYDALKLQTKTNPLFDMRKVFDAFKRMKGMAVKTVVAMKVTEMTMTVSTEVVSVEKAPIPVSTFEVPAGYRKTASALTP